MADLICVAFDDPTTAGRALTELTALQKEFVIQLKDACVVVRPAEGDIQLQAQRLRHPGRFHPRARSHDQAELVGPVPPGAERHGRQGSAQGGEVQRSRA
jgi:hypothetical protein